MARVSCTLTDNEHQRLKVAAALNGETAQEILHRAVIDYLDKTEQALPTYAERQKGAGDG